MLLVIQVGVAHPGELVYAKDAFEPVAAILFFVCDAGSSGVQDPPEGIDIVVFEPEFSKRLNLIFTRAHCPFGWFGRLHLEGLSRSFFASGKQTVCPAILIGVEEEQKASCLRQALHKLHGLRLLKPLVLQE